MRAARKIVVGGALIAAIAVDAWGLWAAAGPVAAGQSAPASRCAVAAIQQAGGTQVVLPVQGPGLDSMGTKRRRRPG
jgi:hypothetical protein